MNNKERDFFIEKIASAMAKAEAMETVLSALIQALAMKNILSTQDIKDLLQEAREQVDVKVKDDSED